MAAPSVPFEVVRLTYPRVDAFPSGNDFWVFSQAEFAWTRLSNDVEVVLTVFNGEDLSVPRTTVETNCVCHEVDSLGMALPRPTG